MKEIKYQIEKQEFWNLISKQYFDIEGWCYSKKDLDIHYEVYMNGQSVPFDMERIFRNDIANNVLNVEEKKIGFHIIARVPDQTVSSFVLKANDMVLLRLNASAIRKLAAPNPIDYRISEVVYQEDKGKFLVKGWAYSALGGDVDVTIEDARSQPVEREVRIVNRVDLIRKGFVESSQSQCGFEILFSADRQQSYRLVLSNHEYRRTIDIYEDTSSKKHLVRSYLSSLNTNNLRKAGRYFKKYGLKQFLVRIKEGPNGTQYTYQNWFDEHKATKQDLQNQRQTSFDYEPMISLIVAAYNTKEEYLKEMIDSVLEQTYTNWQLCIADGSDNDCVQTYIHTHYGKEKRIRYVRLDTNLGISGNMNEAIKLSSGDYIGLFDHDDLLTPDALYEMVWPLQRKRYDVLYSDEDKLNDYSKEFVDPHFKPDLNIDLLRSQNYICHFLMVSRSLVDQIGVLRPAFDGSQDYDFVLRCVEKANDVYHVRKILYHWRMHPQSTAQDPESKMYCYVAGMNALKEHYHRLQIKADVQMMPKPMYGMYKTTYSIHEDPLVSVLILNDDSQQVRKCIQNIKEKSTYKNLEFVIINDRKNVFLSKTKDIVTISIDSDVSVPEKYNQAARQAKGQYLLFLRSDMRMESEESIAQLLGLSQSPQVGIAGSRILYTDNTIQHAGVLFEKDGTVRLPFVGQDRQSDGYMCHPKINCRYLAVSFNGMMVSKKRFLSLNGFDTSYHQAFYDLDLCLKMSSLKRRVVYNAFSQWQAGRNDLYSGYCTNKETYEKDLEIFLKRFKNTFVNGDPCYNPNFDADKDPFTM